MTFLKYTYGEYVLHRVDEIELSSGSQGIPDGFGISAPCGAYEEMRKLKLIEEKEPGKILCPKCFG